MVTGEKTNGEANILALTDYYPFGMDMPGRIFTGENYRFGYQGKEKEKENSLGANYNFGARIYDPRIGRWASTDNFASLYTDLSPYCFVANTPIQAVDPDGNLIIFINGYTGWPANMPVGEDYWGDGTIAMAKYVLKDNNVDPEFYSGSGLGLGNAVGRQTKGRYANEIVDEIIQAYEQELLNDPNATIKFVSHSQGAAYAEGLAENLGSLDILGGSKK